MSLVPSSREKLQEELNKLKSLKGAELRDYVWEYYKFYIIGLLLIIVIAITGIYNAIVNPTPEVVLTVAWAYSSQFIEFYENLENELANIVVHHSQNEAIRVLSFVEGADVQHNMGLQMRFATMMVAGELDILITTREDIISNAAEGLLMDISGLVSASTEDLLRTEGIYGMPADYGISITNSRILENASFFASDEHSLPYIGIFVNSDRKDMAVQVIELFRGS